MDSAFWRQRWARNEIGFHQKRINGYLESYWSGLELPESSTVLVPLCGKSKDMLWLAEQGHAVLGVELAEQAIEDFLSEHSLSAQREPLDNLIEYSAGPLRLLCGDFFDLRSLRTADCAGFYDRAALIALPPPLREQYAEHLSSLMPSGSRGLLVSLEYPQEQKDGPPFCVPDNEVHRLFGRHWQVELLQEDEVLHRNERFHQHGVTYLLERAYRLTRSDE
ncbi:thiopurine S-methyltransferase [Pseudomonas matsuisoli]|uniref:Thiopurine S-methyltransferase n=1 Tax=Pseudomonas matsuisoli TaxID=1515666 RepID=A0A917PHI2_9PSED|nr:thiopurine S-methyltransferase [Pseudomonas matsuisoli]GGJ79105.1 thiopurine S-methyltransferase [Pseudomonas matsuisoli]